MPTTREKLSLLWIFVFLNFIFCDVFSLFYAPTLGEVMTGTAGGVEMNQGVLLGFAVIMELGMVMILVSRLVPYPAARWANLCIAALLVAVQAGSLLTPPLTLHYLFFSAIEIATLLALAFMAWSWRDAG